MKLNACRSKGCVDVSGFYEIMVEGGQVIFCDHDNGPGVQNPDGSWQCDGLTPTEFFQLFSDDVDWIVQQLVG